MASLIWAGVVQGALYALMGSGIAWIYRQSGVLNFGHGAIATLAAFIAYSTLHAGYPYWVAALMALGAGAAAGAATELLLVRRLSGAPHATIGIATLGVGLLLIGLMTVVWGGTPLPLPEPLLGGVHFQIGGVDVSGSQLSTVAVTVAVFVALYLAMERTRFGLALRAASEGPVTASIMGVDVAGLRLVAWAVGGFLAGLAALFVTADNYLDPDFMTTFMISAFAGVVIGGLESVGGTLLGATLFGLIATFLSYAVTGKLQATAVFVSIVLVLAIRPYGIFGRRLLRVPEPVLNQALTSGRRLTLPSLGSPQVRRVVTWAAIAIGVGVMVAVPFLFPQAIVLDLALAMATFLAVLSQNVVTGYSGQLSVGQSAFMLVGAYTSVLTAQYFQLPFLVTLALGGMAAMAAALVAGVVVLRLSGIYLALATLALGLAVPELAAFPAKITGGSLGLSVPPPVLFGVPVTGNLPYWVTLAICCLLGAAVAAAARSAPGRAWRAVRDSEAGAESIGMAAKRVKLRAVVVGGLLAGIAGILETSLIHYLTPDDYSIWTSVYLLAGMMVGGASTVAGAIFGSAFISLIPIWTSGFPQLLQIILGLGIIISVVGSPTGLAGLLEPRRAAPKRGSLARGTQVVADPAPLPER